MGELDEKVRALPRDSGVYLMKDRRHRVIYVGKARDLRSRVGSYFVPSRVSHPRTDALVEKITDVDVLVTDSELEALILEQSLIKEYRPRYNVNLKDDKRFPYLRVNLGHPRPGVEISRQIGDRTTRAFGPYADVASLRHTVKRLRRAFPLRVCSDWRVVQHGRRECLDYFIGSCCAPCTHRVTEAQYARTVQAFVRFLEGHGDDVLEELRAEMAAAADAQEFERAAVFRDRIRAAESVLRKQKIEAPGGDDADVVGLATQGTDALGLVLRVRGGKMVGKDERRLSRVDPASPGETLAQFVMQFYLSQSAPVPPRVVLPFEPMEPALLRGWLEERASGRVEVRVPQRGRLLGLAKVASRNAALLMEERRVSDVGGERAGPELYELKDVLGLTEPPMRIEGVDVSTIHGTDQVASLVVFVAGKPVRSLYRRYRIRRVVGADDFASIQEVVDRRVSRAIAEEQSLPDLLVIDGGEGQLGAAMRALEKYDLAPVPAIGLAKKEERIVFADDRPTLKLPRRSEALRLLQRVRNEAHRFAVAYHRTLRGRRLTASALDDIEGIGPARKALLLRRFGSVREIARAGVEKVAELPGIGLDTARRIVAALASPDEAPPEEPDTEAADAPVPATAELDGVGEGLELDTVDTVDAIDAIDEEDAP